MNTAKQWWQDTQADEAWIDDPTGLLEQIQREAFAAGMRSGVAAAAAVAAREQNHLPRPAICSEPAIAMRIRGIDIDMLIERAFVAAQVQQLGGADAG